MCITGTCQFSYKFITFEGVEGCGKSTQSKILFDSLTQKNILATLTREPGGTKAVETTVVLLAKLPTVANTVQQELFLFWRLHLL